MQNAEFYQDVETKRVELDPVYTCDEPNYPFREHTPDELNLMRLSYEHGRNLTAESVIWEDSQGTLYTSESIKGLPTADDRLIVQEDQTAYGGLRVACLKDNSALNEIMEASQFLREHGFQTECITRAWEITKLEVDGRLMTIEEWKQNMIEEGIIEKEKGKLLHDESRVKAYLDDAQFYTLERHTQVSERLRDLGKANDSLDTYIVRLANGKYYYNGEYFDKISDLQSVGESLPAEESQVLSKLVDYALEHSAYMGVISSGESFKKGLNNCFRWINLYESRHKENPIKKLDSNNEFDIKYYFEEYYPTEMGTYLAKLHDLGVSHGFASAHNWEGVPALCDLDSMTGIVANGSVQFETTEKDLQNDFSYSFMALSELYTFAEPFRAIGTGLQHFPGTSLKLKNETYSYGGYFEQMTNHRSGEMAIGSLVNFTTAYLQHRNLTTEWLDAVAQTDEYMKRIADKGAFKRIKDEVNSRLANTPSLY